MSLNVPWSHLECDPRHGDWVRAVGEHSITAVMYTVTCSQNIPAEIIIIITIITIISITIIITMTDLSLMRVPAHILSSLNSGLEILISAVQGNWPGLYYYMSSLSWSLSWSLITRPPDHRGSSARPQVLTFHSHCSVQCQGSHY